MATQTKTFGPAYDIKQDGARLDLQRDRIKGVMLGFSIRNRWITLSEIQDTLEASYEKRFPEASISAQLRHLRKAEFGGYVLEKRRRGPAIDGVWEYALRGKVILPPEQLKFMEA